MAKLGEPLRSLAGVAADASGATCFKQGYDIVMEEASAIDVNNTQGKISRAYAPVAATSLGLMGGMVEIGFPAFKQAMVAEGDDFYTKAIPAGVVDLLSWFGIIGLAYFTKQADLVIGTKVVYNLAASAVPRVAGAIQRRRSTTT